MIENRVTCDICKNVVTEGNYIHISKLFSYGSKYDGTEIIVDVCEPCFEKYILNNIPEDIKKDIITDIPF